METTVLDCITGSVSMFLFPIIIYFCIFSLMVRSTCASIFATLHALHVCSTALSQLS